MKLETLPSPLSALGLNWDGLLLRHPITPATATSFDPLPSSPSDERLVHSLFERQARASPDAVALESADPDMTMTYRELNDTAVRLAHQLRADPRLDGCSTIIPICMERSVHMVVAILAVLKAGAAYVIMSPDSPAERNRFIVDDTSAPFVLVSDAARGKSGTNAEVHIETLLEQSRETYEQSCRKSLQAQAPSSPAYVIYTSGTTGRPKGVVLSHLAAWTGLSALPRPQGAETLKSLLCFSPVFSAAQRTILGTLTRGGILCLASQEAVTSGLVDTITHFQLESLEITPSMLRLMEPSALPACVKRITLGGEPAGAAVVEAWADKVEFWSAYGLSECTQLNMRSRITKGQGRPILGKPADETVFHILAPGTLSPVPIDTPGELCLSGPQLASGYLNLPDKTAQVFVPNPFGAGLLYRTGDMVRMTPSGTLELLGRTDFQVKIDGQRVEPEVSNTLIQRFPGVVRSAVVPATVHGRTALVAVIVVADKKAGEWADLVRDIRTSLRGEIQRYEIPSFWVEIDEMPVNANGKTDMSGLIRMIEAMDDERLVLPSVHRTVPGEECHFCSQIIEIISKVLCLAPETIDPFSTFLELGGSSINAIVLASKIRGLGLGISVADLLQDLPLKQVFKDLTAANIVAPPESFSLLAEGSLTAEEKADLDDAYPVTPLQEGILADSAMGQAQYVYQRVYKIQGKSPAVVRSALDEVVRKNPILRSTFRPWKRSFIQMVNGEVTVPWKTMRKVKLEKALEQLRKVPMDLDKALVRVTVLDSKLLIVEMHHALFDFWSSQFIFADIETLLRGDELVARAPFSAYVAYQQGVSRGPNIDDYWREYLGGAQDTLLTIAESKDGRTSDQIVISRDLGDSLVDFCSHNGVSLGAAVHQAWALTLARHLSTTDVVYLAAFSGRDAEVEGVLSLNGPTLCSVPVRIQLDQADGAASFSKGMQNKLWTISKFAPHGLRNVLAATGIQADSMNTIVNILGNSGAVHEEHKHLLPVLTHGDNFTQYITLEIEEFDPRTAKLLIPFAADVAAADRVLATFAETVGQMAASPETPVSVMASKPPLEASSPDASSSAEHGFRLAHAAFEQHAKSNPERIAIRTRDGEITYGEFDAKSTKFAQQLIRGGVKAGDMVPLYMEKSAHTLVAIFGILNAGAAFVPLDPRNPVERNKFIITDISADRIITDQENSESCAAFGLPMILTNQLVSETVGSDEDVPLPSVGADMTAYVIYTSGSTGVPKGVLVPHSAVDAATRGMIEATAVTQDWVALWVLNYIFDASYYDVFTIFAAGACLCVAPQDEVLADLAGHINTMGVQQVMLTPTITKLIRGGPADVPDLKVLNVCGEKIDTNILEWARSVDVYNGYGPTEATILMTVSKVEPDGDLASIGYPLRHVSAVIIPAEGESLDPVEEGQVGELCVLGPQLASGYLNRPEQTAKVFIKDASGKPIYRTGDLARWAPDGSLICLGRKDYQVKLNGFRIELGEIENAILRTGQVSATVVSIAQVNGKPQLVAFCILDGDQIQSDHAPLPADARRSSTPQIKDKLTSIAHYMMPSLFLYFNSFKTLPSGKVDRKALVTLVETMTPAEILEHIPSSGGPVDFVAVETDEERAMQEAWASVLGLPAECIGASTEFLRVGGDSIAAISVVAECRRLGFAVSVGQVLASSTLRAQAAFMKRAAAAATQSAEPVEYSVPESVEAAMEAAGLSMEDVQDVYPCGPGQIEFLTQGKTEHHFWNLTAYRALPDGFDLEKWLEVTKELTARNEILRASFIQAEAEDPSSWYQVILNKPMLNWDEVSYETEDEMQHHVQQLRHRRFNFGKPNVQYLLLRCTPTNTLTLAIKLDHGTYDGTLLRIFDEQFTAIARGASEIPSPSSFRSFIDTIYTSDTAADLDFWTSELDSYTPTHNLPLQPVTDRLKFVPLSTNIDADALAASLGVTPSTLFQGALAIAAGKLTQTSDVLVDQLITGRNVAVDRPQQLGGTCANFLPARTRLDPTAGAAAFFRGVQAEFWTLTERGAVGLHDIYEALGRDRQAHAAKILFCFQPFEPTPPGTGVDHMRWVVLAQSKVFMTVNYALMVEVQKTVGGYRLKLQWDSRAFSEGDIDGAVGMIEGTFRRIAEDKEVLVRGL